MSRLNCITFELNGNFQTNGKLDFLSFIDLFITHLQLIRESYSSTQIVCFFPMFIATIGRCYFFLFFFHKIVYMLGALVNEIRNNNNFFNPLWSTKWCLIFHTSSKRILDTCTLHIIILEEFTTTLSSEKAKSCIFNNFKEHQS